MNHTRMITILTSKFRPNVNILFFFETSIKDQEYEEHFRFTIEIIKTSHDIK